MKLFAAASKHGAAVLLNSILFFFSFLFSDKNSVFVLVVDFDSIWGGKKEIDQRPVLAVGGSVP